MDGTVLGALGMAASTFEQGPSAADATPHDAEGAPMPAYRHAALAAAGLLTTGGDLARFGAAIATGAIPAGMDGARARDGRALWPRAGAGRARPGPRRVTRGRTGGGARSSRCGARPGAGIVVLANGEGGDAVRSAVLAELVA